MAHFRKLFEVPKSRKNLLPKPSFSPFCFKLRCHVNGCRSKKMRLAAFDRPSSTPLAKISYPSRVIAHYIPNFVAMATRIGREKMWLAAFDGSFSKKFINKKISQKFLTQAALLRILFQISLTWQRVSMKIKCNWQHSMVHSWKLPYMRNNLAKIFFTQAAL